MASESFVLNFLHSSTHHSVVCSCGITHYVPEDQGGSFEEDEYEKFIKERDKCPDRYVASQEDVVGWGSWGGKNYVVDCPCQFIDNLEKEILDNRDIIISFLKDVVEKDIKKAEAEIAEGKKNLRNLSGS